MTSNLFLEKIRHSLFIVSKFHDKLCKDPKMNCICDVDISEEVLSLSKQFYQVSQHVATYVIYIFCVKK